MRSLLAPPTIALLAIGVGGCGGAKGTGSSSQVSSNVAVSTSTTQARASGSVPADGYLKGDDDNDADARNRFDDHLIRDYGHAARAADRKAVTALVKRYYAAAVADLGATVCSLMSPHIAGERNLGEASEEAFALAASLPPLHGKSCAQIMTLLFKEDHVRVTVANSTLVVTSVRINGSRGYALLGFRATPERYVSVERERGRWKIDALRDLEIP
jgi:hypothetical protein